MYKNMIRLPFRWVSKTLARSGAVALSGALALALVFAASAQQADQTRQPAAAGAEQQQAPAPPPPVTAPETAPAAAPSTESQPAVAPQPAQAAEPATKPAPSQAGEITEAEVKQLLVGKELFLLGGYLNDNLSFNEHGVLIGHSPTGSYTLSAIRIDRVKLSKHKVELEGERYALHFLGNLPYEEIGKSVDRVNITPKKKSIKITIDRELVVAPKKQKEGKSHSGKSGKPEPAAKTAATAVTASAGESATAPAQTETAATPAQPETAATPAATTAATTAPASPEPSEADQLKAAIAAAPAAERPADPKSMTTTTSPAHANKVFKDALDKIFAQGFDDRLMATMPGFWKLYYQAAAAKTDYRPNDPAVMRQNTVDKKARLLTFTDPASNEYAQANGVAGMALYHTVVGADGKAAEIAVARPIGFGLDENAVDAIRKATFSPAIYDGKPVPVLLDMVVEFHIYSKRTAALAKPGQKDQPEEPSLPGPYSRQEQQ
jgi:TonB family protein